MRAKSILSVGSLLGIAVLTAGTMMPFDESNETPAGSDVYISAAEQLSAEQLVADFSAQRPMPSFPENATPSEVAEIQAELVDYWHAVPWEAVLARWDCQLDAPAVVNFTDGGEFDGAPVLNISFQCGDNEADSLAVQNATNLLTSPTEVAAA